MCPAERSSRVGAGGVPASPRKMPDSTALGPAVRVTVIETVPPAATEIGKETHAPWLKSLESVRALPVDGDDLSPALGVPVHRVEVEVARVGFLEAQLHLDLVGVVVGGGVARVSAGLCQRTRIGGVLSPLIAAALLDGERRVGQVGDVACRAVPAGQVIARRADGVDPGALGSAFDLRAPGARLLRRGRCPTAQRWVPRVRVDRDR